MKILLIGGTGTISSAITRQLAAAGHDLWLLNRGHRSSDVPAHVKQVIADINDEEKVRQCLEGHTFDAVCEFIGFLPSQVLWPHPPVRVYQFGLRIRQASP